MDALMQAYAQVIARARDAVSEAGATVSVCGNPHHFVLDGGAHIPEPEFQALVEALEDLEVLEDAERRAAEIDEVYDRERDRRMLRDYERALKASTQYKIDGYTGD